MHRKHIFEKKDTLLRFKYSNQEILNDALHPLKPLAWLTEKDSKEFILQGTSLFSFPDGAEQLIGVVTSNEKEGDQKYWFSDYVHKKKHHKYAVKVQPVADVTYAADIDLLGFGKIILLLGWNPIKQREEIRLGVLVDTGSAFKNNLAKLDMFTGYFPDDSSFKKHIASYPETAKAYILIKKK